MNKKPQVLVLRTDGTNCDEELFFAFQLAGAQPRMVHVNQLRNKKEKLNNFQILALPGGFSYGDDVASAKILSVELTSFFSDELRRFVNRKDTLTIGLCNGFQALVRTGLLPFRKIGSMDVTLTNNDSGHFECRWVKMKIEKSACEFLNPLVGKIVSYTTAHGEGKFFAQDETIDKIEEEKLVAIRYVDENGNPTQHYPQNPNGSLHAIAGITDKTGRVFGMMPHPERFVRKEQYPNWRRVQIDKPHGLILFEQMVKYVKSA